ncbi:MAG: phosphotyrosine protein phosphatase [Candidatus Bathyarchaeota archaeon]|nr:phosphotyrosine protein phosphatase [Candidatus Bathyarchaeota archaeon]MDH5687523.1 phosphotyrosine protein phosphatase [Candidatus Bathyarchaeota archaeon]
MNGSEKAVERVLFVCTGNMDRSPTAEALLKRKGDYEVKSAGTWLYAARRISLDLIEWADLIFVMEEHHRDVVLGICRGAENKTVVLGIPDRYPRNSPQLIGILKAKLSEHLGIDL